MLKHIAGVEPVVWQEVAQPPEPLGKGHGLKLQKRWFLHPLEKKPIDFDEFIKNDGITTCALTPRKTMLLIKEFGQASGEIVWKFAATTSKVGEDALLTAARELQEETAHSCRQISETTPGRQKRLVAPRKSPSGFRTFLALDCYRVPSQKLDREEAQIAVYEADPETFWDMYMRGDIKAVETIEAAFNAACYGFIPFPETWTVDF